MHGLDTMHRLNNLAASNQTKVQEINDEAAKREAAKRGDRDEAIFQKGFDQGHAEASQDNEANTEVAYEDGSNEGYESGYEEGHVDGQEQERKKNQGPDPIRDFLQEAGIDPVEPVTMVWDAALKALVWTQGPYILTQGAERLNR